MARDLINSLLNMNIGQASEKKIGIVYLDIDKVVPSDDNFYHINDDDIQMMAYAIEAVGQIEQPLLVKKIDSDKYELIAGHKRRAGANYLVEHGKGEYRTLPCIIKDESIENELSLILTNSTQRELTSFEKMKQVEILRNYIEKYEIKGNKREIISNLINLSKSEVGRLENISKNLNEPLKEEFQAGTIATGTANMIASLPEEQQERVQEIIRENGTVKMSDIKVIREEDASVPGQMEVEDYPELLTEEMQQEKARKRLVELYFKEYNKSTKDIILTICADETSNADKAKRIQMFLAPNGYSGGQSSTLNFNFYSFSRGIVLSYPNAKTKEEQQHYTYSEFLKYILEIFEKEIETLKKQNTCKKVVNVSDSEFLRVLEDTWKKCTRDYELSLKNPVPRATLLKFRILKEAMDMYRSNYMAEEEAKRDDEI